MIKLTVKSINTVSYTPYDQLFDPNDMELTRASGQDTLFYYLGKEYVVDQTFAQVQAALEVASAGASLELWAMFDATGGKAIGTYNMVDPVTLAEVVLPANAIVTDGFYIVGTTFTSATDAATISLGINTNDTAGLKAAIAISNGANPYDAGNKAIIQDGAVANFSEITTAERKIEAIVAVEALTAGVLKLCLKYSIRP
jgi:hypothetical protein